MEPILPKSPDAEHALINLSLHDPQFYFSIQEAGVTSEMFLDENASFLFGLIGELTNKGYGTHPTTYTIQSHLRSNGMDNEAAYHKRIFAQVINNQWATRYSQQVIDSYKKRELIRLSQQIAGMAYDSLLPSDAINVQVYEVLERLDLLGKVVEIHNGRAISNDMRKFFDTASDRPAGSPWGLELLDKATGGTRLGEFTMFKGNEGNGKSALLQQVAYYRASIENPRPQLWITIGDMTKDQIMTRIMQQHTGVSSNQLSRGWFNDKENRSQWHVIDRELTRLQDIPFYIIEGGELESKDLKRVIQRALHLEKTFDVYIDYLQQLTDKGDIYQSTSTISHNLLALAHHTRDGEGQPQISLTAISGMNKGGDHFGAKRLAHDPENIFSITLEPLPGAYDGVTFDKIAKIDIEKQRNGPKGFSLKFLFEGRYTRFSGTTQ